MLHGLAWKSKRLGPGTRRKDAKECNVEEDVGSIESEQEKERKNKAFLETRQFGVVGIIDDEDDGIEAELFTGNAVLRHGPVSPDTSNTKRDIVVLPSVLPSDNKTAPGRHDRPPAEVGKAYDNEGTKNSDELLARSLKMRREETGSEEFVIPADRRSSNTRAPRKLDDEQRDDIGVDDEEDLPAIPEEHDSTRDGRRNSRSVSDTVFEPSSRYEEESNAAGQHHAVNMDAMSTSSTLWVEDGTSPIDFVKAIITGEVWSDLFDDGKKSRHPRLSDKEDVNALLDTITDFIQGDESRRAYFESQVRLLSSTQSRREQARAMNASRVPRETKVLPLLRQIPTKSINHDSNLPKQSNKVTPNGSYTKSGVVAFMKNRHPAREIITPIHKESPVKTRPDKSAHQTQKL